MATYTVKSGDTLSEIAIANHTTWQALYALNKALIGADPDLIKVGQVLKLPVVVVTPPPAPKPVPPKPVKPEDIEPPMDMKRVTYGSRTVNQRTKTLLLRAAAKYNSGVGWTLDQGSYNKGGVSASAGTHDGGGVVDVRIASLSAAQRLATLKALRQAGFAAWLRTPAEGFPYHIHAVAIGDREMSSSAHDQVVAYFAGRNGLAGNGHDTAPASVGRPYPAWAAKYKK